jgi:putative ABC transport system permease protein
MRGLGALARSMARVRAFFGTLNLDRDFEQELESHLAMLIDDNIRRGMTPDAARRAALIRIGSRSSITEQHRAVRGLPKLETLLQDLRFAVRLMNRERWFSASVIATLACGIGVNAIGFTIVNAAFIRSLPFDGSERLYALSWQTPSGLRGNVSHADFQEWRARTRSFDGVAAYVDGPMNISDDRVLPEQAQGTWLTANAFGVLKQPLLLGRDFVGGDEAPGAQPVVIIGHRIWRTRYGSDPGVLGKSLRVNGQPAIIVGVMPQGMRFPDNTDVWAVIIPPVTSARRDVHSLRVFGRLADRVAPTAAQAEFNGIARQLKAAFPDTAKRVLGVRVEPLTDRFVGGKARTMFVTIMVAVGFVLLIACTNVANLLLSRSAYRAREIALRMALGATRWRVVRQLLLESVVLSAVGGAAGLVLAVAGVGLFETAMQASEKPYWLVFTVDRVVVGYVAAICMLTGVLFGLAPALHVSQDNSYDALKEGGRGATAGRRVRWFSSAMVIAELALTIVLLAGAGLMTRSFMRLYTLDIGIDIARLTTMRLQLPEGKYPSPETRRAFFDRLGPRLRTIPGVESFAVTTGVPPLDGGERLLEVDSFARTSEPPRFVSTVTITPEFFEVMGRSLIRGRRFGEADGAPGSESVIINERLAAEFFPGEDPVGRQLRFTQRDPALDVVPDRWRTIVGISPAIRHGSAQDAYLNPVVYLPYRQDAPRAASLVVRSALPPASIMEAVRREVRAIDEDQPVFTIQTVEEMLAAGRWPYRIFGSLFVVLGVIALVLSCVALYAVMAYSVTQRTQEIGVRMALGARRQQVSWLILKRGFVQLAIGLPLGLAGALALGVVLQGMLVDLLPGDPLTLAAVTVLLTIVSVAACLIPALRATRIDPVVALRAE